MSKNIFEQNNLFIVAAPSGAGKTSLVQALADTIDEVELSISHTTRGKRPHEENGVHYHYVNETKFQQMVKDGMFLEYAKVFDHFYGTSKQAVDNTLKQGKDVILEIDWQGAAQVRQLVPECVSIFILPPSIEELESRLINRNEDSDEIIKGRMAKAQQEISHYAEFDYIVINDDFTQALFELQAIIKASKLELERRQPHIKDLITSLLSQL